MLSVSVVIPCYNGARYLGEALQSALAQTRPPKEVLVVDDASTDGSAELAEAWAHSDPRIRVIRMPRNGGDADARNAGIRAATADLVAMLDADDTWEPWHLAEGVALLERYPEAVLSSATARLTGRRSGSRVPRYPAGAPSRALFEALAQAPHHQSTVIMRRAEVLAIGGYAAGGRAATDCDLWIRLAMEHPFVCSHRVTATYRWHGRQISSRPARQIEAAHRYRRVQLDRMWAEGRPEAAEAEALVRRVWRRDLRYALRDRTPAEARALHAQWRTDGIPPLVAAGWWLRMQAALVARAVRSLARRLVSPTVKARIAVARRAA